MHSLLGQPHLLEQPEVNHDGAISVPCRLQMMSAKWLARQDLKASYGLAHLGPPHPLHRFQGVSSEAIKKWLRLNSLSRAPYLPSSYGTMVSCNCAIIVLMGSEDSIAELN